jgi:hypothetical protein
MIKPSANNKDRMLPVRVTCRSCSGTFEFEIPEKGLREWQSGTLIQKALPSLSAPERELLISQTCDECFSRLWADPSDQEDEDE